MQSPLGDPAAWQAMLDRHAELFSEMNEGARVGFISRANSGLAPGKHVAGLIAASGGGDMLSWQRCGDGMRSRLEPYVGFAQAGVDLLFVAEDEALETVRAGLQGEALSIIKRLIRKGGIMFYVMKNKYQLQEAGYEDFLDSLGLAFLGACR